MTYPRPTAEFGRCENCGDEVGGSGVCCSRRAPYRYLLRVPTGLNDQRIVTFIGANPSTATAEQLDPTLRRCLGYAKAWGYGWLYMANVRAWRETDPKKVPAHPEAIGTSNNNWLFCSAQASSLLVCAWGRLGQDRADHVLRLVRSTRAEPHVLKWLKDNVPGHPLYLRADLKPIPMDAQ